MGHLEVETPDGRTFSVGSGFTDAQRDKPPKVGAIITYKFQELSNKLTPRFPTFLGERIDIKWQDYCKTYTAPTLKTATSAKVVSLLKQKSLIFQDGDEKDVDKVTKTKDFLDGDDENLSDRDSTGDSDLDIPKAVSSPSTSSSSNTDTSSSAVSTPSRKRAATGVPSRLVMSDSDDDDDSNTTKSKQPVCKYGASCYRRNPDHLKQFSHPNKRAKA